jgi:hypothetical protein
MAGERLWQAKRALEGQPQGRVGDLHVCVWMVLIMADKRAATGAVGGRAQML